MRERKRRSVLQRTRADGDGMRRPPVHLGRIPVDRTPGADRRNNYFSKLVFDL